MKSSDAHKESMRKYSKSPKGKETLRKYKEKNQEKIKEYHKNYSENHRDKFNEYGRNSYPKYKDDKRGYERRITAEFKSKFFALYGNCCACCGESIIDFLTIEHKNGQRKDGYKETGLRAYRIACQEYRPDLYEVLCWNCNCAKGKLGYCPHKLDEVIQKVMNEKKP